MVAGGYFLNFVDIIYIFIIGFFVIYGLFKGFVHEFVSLLSWIVGYYMAVNYYADLSMMYNIAGLGGLLKDTISIIVIFFGVQVLAWPVKKVLHYVIKLISLGQLNIIFGGGVGLVKGYICSLLLATAIPFTPWSKHAEVKKSELHIYFVKEARHAGNDAYIKGIAGNFQKSKKSYYR